MFLMREARILPRQRDLRPVFPSSLPRINAQIPWTLALFPLLAKTLCLFSFRRGRSKARFLLLLRPKGCCLAMAVLFLENQLRIPPSYCRICRHWLLMLGIFPCLTPSRLPSRTSRLGPPSNPSPKHIICSLLLSMAFHLFITLNRENLFILV